LHFQSGINPQDYIVPSLSYHSTSVMSSKSPTGPTSVQVFPLEQVVPKRRKKIIVALTGATGTILDQNSHRPPPFECRDTSHHQQVGREHSEIRNGLHHPPSFDIHPPTHKGYFRVGVHPLRPFFSGCATLHDVFRWMYTMGVIIVGLISQK
jgi:hypothetical protein